MLYLCFNNDKMHSVNTVSNLNISLLKGRGFYIVAAGASASQSWAQMNTAIQHKGFKVALTNLAEDIGLLAIQGPKR